MIKLRRSNISPIPIAGALVVILAIFGCSSREEAADTDAQSTSAEPPDVSFADEQTDVLAGTWITTELDSSNQIDFAGASGLKLVILGEQRDHDMYLFAVYPDGELCRCHDSRPTRIDDRKMFLGPFGSCMAFEWERNGELLRWSKEKDTVCVFKKTGPPDMSMVESWSTLGDSYQRFREHF